MKRVGFAFLMAGLAAMATPAMAAEFIVEFKGVTTIPNNNNFKGNLNGLGLYTYANFDTKLSLSGPAKITFERVGSESGYTNRFTAGTVTGLESDGNFFAAPVLIGTGTDVFAGGDLLNRIWFNSQNNGDRTDIGEEGFGIFLPRGAVTGYRSKVLYFGFDDLVNNDDDNHDDFILRATVSAIPEPATWAMLIAGFGLVGFAARRRGTGLMTA